MGGMRTNHHTVYMDPRLDAVYLAMIEYCQPKSD